MKNIQSFFAVLVFTLLLVSCTKEQLAPELNSFNPSEELLLSDQEVLDLLQIEEEVESRVPPQAAVFTLSNQSSSNQVIVFHRHADGTLTEFGRYATGGTGTSGGLGNQGALALNRHGKFLYVVNAGSNEISFFYVKRDASLILLDKIGSGGERPVSIATRNGLIYVLNAGGTGNITGFGFNQRGKLVQIHHSTRPLSSDAAGAAQISFSSNGRALIVTEKATNTITTYALHGRKPSEPIAFPAAGATPFGFAVGGYNTFFVSEAAGGSPGASTISSYRVNNDGYVTLVDGPLATNATAACWVALTQDYRTMFVTNTGSNDISSLSANSIGQLDIINDGNTTPSGQGPIDAALDPADRYLYVLNAGDDTVSSYRVGNNGALTSIDNDGGLPDGATGIVVR